MVAVACLGSSCRPEPVSDTQVQAAPRELTPEQFQFMARCTSHLVRHRSSDFQFDMCLKQLDLLWGGTRIVRMPPEPAPRSETP